MGDTKSKGSHPLSLSFERTDENRQLTEPYLEFFVTAPLKKHHVKSHVASVCICLLYVAMLSLVISPNFTPSRTQSHRFVERRPQVHLPAGRSGAGAGAPCVAYLGLVAMSQDPAEVCCLQFFPLVA